MKRVVGDVSLTCEWARERSYAGVDYTFDRAGNMTRRNRFFSARSKVNGRIVRIVQETPEEGEGVRHWIDESESELTVVCVLEEQFIEQIKVLVGSWIG
ncbi:hypothetical protein [Lysobacter capsici]|uniref:hypothetical protein n=1 Tax=Lysobacter capsici TaxID=435897 RepID=UPI001C00357E|nr:hypothetical protein [Lysobacter capsici]QWF19562.1 hypothetical protein KME82_12855 [Lysobacter capsici]